MKKEEFKAQYEGRRKEFESLRTSIFGLVSKAITEAGVSAMPILSRTKDLDSAVSKFERKKYDSPFQQMTDIVGFRVVLYLEHEIELFEKTLREYFKVDEKNSVDRRKPTDVQKVGYRSLHLICTLGEERRNLPEYQDACDIPFEIQVRTALEQAWAEIEHKQKYKSKVALPSDLQRRLNILSGNLELIDKELSRIALAANDYKHRLNSGDDSVESDYLSATSVLIVCEKFAQENRLKVASKNKLNPSEKSTERLIEELTEFGVHTVKDFQDLLGSLPIEEYKKNEDDDNTVFGIIRDAMIINNHKKYFKKCYWGQFDFEVRDVTFYNKLIDDLEDIETLIYENGGEIRYDDE
ncbi:GTP pyrophosphokinase [Ruegeria atlantica]|uniref:GTP pyrophosphokinase n=1 Tax=Ruegeria atlantica TaxID=81569 RepID=UPI00147D623F|nr:RelA/SpoT domain-containing protein [Ruegeria atlantica]